MVHNISQRERVGWDSSEEMVFCKVSALCLDVKSLSKDWTHLRPTLCKVT